MAQSTNTQPQSTQQQQPRSLTQRIGEGFEAFWKTPAEIQAARTPPQNTNQNQQQQQFRTPAGLEDEGNQPPNERKEPNAMDAYKGIWDNAPPLDAAGKPIVPTEAPKFQLDPKVVKDAASKINLMDGLPPELTEKMQTGQMQPADYQALAMHTGQRAYEHAIQHATALTDRFVTQRLEHEQQGLEGKFSKLLAKSKVFGSEAIKNNPALAEHLEEVTERLHSKHPDKDADWVAAQAVKYFEDIATGMGFVRKGEGGEPSNVRTNQEGSTVRSDGKVFDFESYLQENPNR